MITLSNSLKVEYVLLKCLKKKKRLKINKEKKVLTFKEPTMTYNARTGRILAIMSITSLENKYYVVFFLFFFLKPILPQKQFVYWHVPTLIQTINIQVKLS